MGVKLTTETEKIIEEQVIKWPEPRDFSGASYFNFHNLKKGQKFRLDGRPETFMKVAYFSREYMVDLATGKLYVPEFQLAFPLS